MAEPPGQGPTDVGDLEDEASAPDGVAATSKLERIARICEERLRDDERAITCYQQILEIDPGHRGALEALGRIYETTERWADFVEVTRKQIEVTADPALEALLYFRCGSVMEAKFGEEDEAIRYYEAAIDTSPSCMPAVHGLRDVYRRREDWTQVVSTLELELELWNDDKERAGVLAQIGRVYGTQLDRSERALHYFERALALDPDCVPANRALFEVCFESQDWERAQSLASALAQKAMREGDPSARSRFYRQRGIVCHQTGDPRGAAESLIIALEIRPTSIEALDALTEVAADSPDAYDFESTYRELARIYNKRADCAPLFARVRMGQATMAERRGDLETAEKLLADAISRAPHDIVVLAAVVDLHRRMRRWNRAAGAILRFLSAGDELPVSVRADALLLQAEIHADGQMDSQRAIEVLREVIELCPDLADPHERLAQELFALGRYAEAQSEIETVISLVATPGQDVSSRQLARHHYYLGRVLEASGDHRSAANQYRRAADHDAGFAEPILALARRAAAGGDLAAAQSTLIDAAHRAIEVGGKQAAIPMQRGLARLQMTVGDPAGAIDAYRGMLAVNPDDTADRIALAELYVGRDLRKAIRELLRVIERDIRVGPVYKELAALYSRAGREHRAYRVLAVMGALGFADEQDVAQLHDLRSKQTPIPFASTIDDQLRRKLLYNGLARAPRGELVAAMEAELASHVPAPSLFDLQPVSAAANRELWRLVDVAGQLFEVHPEVYLREGVPAGALFLSTPRPIVVIDRSIADEDQAATRFLLGYAFEAIRGNCAALLQLHRRQQDEMLALLEGRGDTGTANRGELVAALPRRVRELIERIAEAPGLAIGAGDWVRGMVASARRAGLLMADDLSAATRVIVRLSGESLGRGDGVSAALGAAICGPDLVRYYLSDHYNELRNVLAEDRRE